MNEFCLEVGLNVEKSPKLSEGVREGFKKAEKVFLG